MERSIFNDKSPCCEGCFGTGSRWEKPTADLSCALGSVPYFPPKPLEKSEIEKIIFLRYRQKKYSNLFVMDVSPPRLCNRNQQLIYPWHDHQHHTHHQSLFYHLWSIPKYINEWWELWKRSRDRNNYISTFSLGPSSHNHRFVLLNMIESALKKWKQTANVLFEYLINYRGYFFVFFIALCKYKLLLFYEITWRSLLSLLLVSERMILAIQMYVYHWKCLGQWRFTHNY